jgi:transposase
MLYHAFGIRNVKYLRTRYEDGAIIFEAEMTRKLARCPDCRSRKVIYKGSRTRELRMVPIGGKKTWLHLTVHKLLCKDCGALRWPRLPFAPPNVNYTTAFERLTLELLRFATILAAANFLGCGWDLVKDIHKRCLGKRYRHIKMKNVRYIAIDEFSVRKGWVYMTIAIDLRDGRILHVAPGKGAASIKSFLKTLARRAPNLKAVAVDMNEGYISALRRWLPQVDIVLDRYHISALVNRAIDELRREHQAELGKLGSRTLKGSRFLLLANYEELPFKRRRRLDRLLEVNRPLYAMHAMKEQLRLFWDLGRDEAERFLAAWCSDAMESGIRPLIKVGRTLALYRNLILNYFKHRITCGKIEGINNKIKTLKRQHYGFRDEEYFKLRLFNLHEQRYQLTG